MAVVEGWFDTPGRAGDRTLESQRLGLDPLFAECAGKWILDVGCAEGLIAIELAKAGAERVHGVEIVPGHIAVAKGLAEGLPCEFEVGDASTYRPVYNFDIVILLAVLHKLKNPSVSCARIVERCRDLCVIRLPPDNSPTIIDLRSGKIPHNIQDVMSLCGFVLEHVERGPFEEWVGYFRRVRP